MLKAVITAMVSNESRIILFPGEDVNPAPNFPLEEYKQPEPAMNTIKTPCGFRQGFAEV